MLLVIKEKIIMYSKFFLVFKILKSKLIAMADEKITGSSDPQQNNKTNSSSSYLDNLNLNENDDSDVDAEEISCPRKRSFNKIYEEFKTYKDLKAATEDLGNLGWIKDKRRKEKQLFRCKRGCPKALYCMLTNKTIHTNMHDRNKHNC